MLFLYLLHHIVFVFRPIYVFGMVRKYIVCECSSCPAYPGTNLRSWRTFPKPGVPDTGPKFCRFCETPFQFPRLKGDKKGRGGDGGPGGAGGSAGGAMGKKGGQSGSSSDVSDEWFQRNSKGRSRRVHFRVEDDVADEAALEDLLRKKLAARPSLAGVADDIMRECFPKKPKTQKEMLHDGMSAVDKARSAQEHLAKVCSQMQDSYDRRFEELVQYKANLDEHYAKLESAKAAFASATADLLELQSANSDSTKAVENQGSLDHKKLLEVTQSYNPMAGISRVLAGLQAVGPLDPGQAKQISDAMSTEFKGQLAQLCDYFAPPVPPAPQPPPPPPPASPAAPGDDAAMVPKFKRSIDEVAGEGVGGAMDDADADIELKEQIRHDCSQGRAACHANAPGPQGSGQDAADEASARAKELAGRVQEALASRAAAAASQSPP